MIVRDEEDNLPRSLASLRGVVDEIVVVDTGSTDRTREVALEHGARVSEFPWSDDFSAARNESLRRATGDYLVWVDADEELVELSPGDLRRLCGDLPAGVHGYMATVVCPLDAEGVRQSVLDQCRVFRNKAGLTFVGRVHEQLTVRGKLDARRTLAQNRVSFQHWGYVPEGDRMQRKGERNLRLLQRAAGEEPDSETHAFFLGQHYAWAERWPEAMTWFDRAIDLWQRRGSPITGFLPAMFGTAALAALQCGEYQRVLDLEALTPQDVLSSEVLCAAGMALRALNQPDEAVGRLSRACQDPSVRKRGGGDPSTYGWRPLLTLAEIYRENSRWDDSYHALERALDSLPPALQPATLFALADACQAVGRSAEIPVWLRRAVAVDSDSARRARTRRAMLDLANTSGDADLALEALSGEVDGIPGPDAAMMRAQVYATTGSTAARRAALEEALARWPEDSRLKQALDDL